MHGENLEIEIKIRLSVEIKEIEERILREGFFVESDFCKEENIFFDRDNYLKKRGFALRLRSYGNRNTLTLKGKSKEKRIKERKEWEVKLSSKEEMEEILNILGFKVILRYTKERKIFKNSENTIITIDKTPFGNFLEIEGKRNKIEDLVEKLNLNSEEVEEKNYLELYRNYFGQKK